MNEVVSLIPSRIKSAVPGGHVTGAEDIDFNKEYAPADFSGMGCVVLEKNIQDVSGTDKNLLTQDMFYKGEVGSRVPNINTVFIIQYDFELAEDITVPANCVLEFDGGSISGAYTLTGANTDIQAGLVKILNTNIIFAGTWNVSKSYPEWFGDTEDWAININKCLSIFKCCYLLNKEYITYTAIELTRYSVLKGCGKAATRIKFYGADDHAIILGTAANVSDFEIYAFPNPTTGDFAGKSIVRIYNNDGSDGTNTRGWSMKNMTIFSSPQAHTNQTIGVELYSNTWSQGVCNVHLEDIDVIYPDVGYYFNCPNGWINENGIYRSSATACGIYIKLEAVGNSQIESNDIDVWCQLGGDTTKIYDISGTAIVWNRFSGNLWDFHEYGKPSANHRIGKPYHQFFPNRKKIELSNDRTKCNLIGVMDLNGSARLSFYGGYSGAGDNSKGTVIKDITTHNGVLTLKETNKNTTNDINLYYETIDDEVYIYANADYSSSYLIDVSCDTGFITTNLSYIFINVTEVIPIVKTHFEGERKMINGRPFWYGSYGRYYSEDGLTYDAVVPRAGGPGKRPGTKNLVAGFMYYDFTLFKPIWYVSGYWIGGRYYSAGWIDGSGTIISWIVTYNLTNLDTTNHVPIKNQEFETYLTANAGYSLPSTITISMGGATLVAGTDYTYNSSTGKIVVLGSGGTGGVTADITITASGIAN